MMRPNPLSEILSRLGDDSAGRSQCMVPVDDDWKERMRALARSAEAEGKAQDAGEAGQSAEEQPAG